MKKKLGIALAAAATLIVAVVWLIAHLEWISTSLAGDKSALRSLTAAGGFERNDPFSTGMAR